MHSKKVGVWNKGIKKFLEDVMHYVYSQYVSSLKMQKSRVQVLRLPTIPSQYTSVQPRHRCPFHLFPIWFIDFFSFLCCSLSILIFILFYESNYINCRAFLLSMPTLTQCPYFTCSALVHDIFIDLVIYALKYTQFKKDLLLLTP